METDSIVKGFNKKLGPLPAWAWGMLAAAGIWIYRNLKPEPVETVSDPGSIYGTLNAGGGMTIPAPPIETGYGKPLSYITLPGDYYFEGDADDLARLLALLPGYTGNPASTSPNAPYIDPGVGTPIQTGAWNIQLIETGMAYNHNFATLSECEALRASIGGGTSLYRCIQT